MLAPTALLAKRLLTPDRRRTPRPGTTAAARRTLAARGRRAVLLRPERATSAPRSVLRTHERAAAELPPNAPRRAAARRHRVRPPRPRGGRGRPASSSPARRIPRRRSSAPSTAARCARPNRPGAPTSPGSRDPQGPTPNGRPRASRPARGSAAALRCRRRAPSRSPRRCGREDSRRPATPVGRRSVASRRAGVSRPVFRSSTWKRQTCGVRSRRASCSRSACRRARARGTRRCRGPPRAVRAFTLSFDQVRGDRRRRPSRRSDRTRARTWPPRN